MRVRCNETPLYSPDLLKCLRDVITPLSMAYLATLAFFLAEKVIYAPHFPPAVFNIFSAIRTSSDKRELTSLVCLSLMSLEITLDVICHTIWMEMSRATINRTLVGLHDIVT